MRRHEPKKTWVEMVRHDVRKKTQMFKMLMNEKSSVAIDNWVT